MKLLLLISLFYFSLLDAAAQRADLIISDGVLQTNNINRGDHLQFSFRVKNAGNANAAKSHTSIYISSTPSATNAI